MRRQYILLKMTIQMQTMTGTEYIHKNNDNGYVKVHTYTY